MEKSVKQTLLERRSIRRYEREPVSDEDMDFIYRSIRNTPTSYNGQQYSVIDITDQEIKEKIYAMTGAKQVKTCSHFLVFVADYHKVKLLARVEGVEDPEFQDTLDGLTVATLDAGLAMMSAVTAAESRGLGTCCVGYARTADPEGIAALLGLPKYTYVVCGLSIGVPREMPDMKPKQPLELIVHRNRYNSDETAMTEQLSAYNGAIEQYNGTRTGTKSRNDWVHHMMDYYREAMGYEMLDALEHRGFDIRS